MVLNTSVLRIATIKVLMHFILRQHLLALLLCAVQVELLNHSVLLKLFSGVVLVQLYSALFAYFDNAVTHHTAQTDSQERHQKNDYGLLLQEDNFSVVIVYHVIVV